MAYRDPRFYFHHAFRTAGAAALGGTSFDAAQPRARVHDSAIARTGKFGATSANMFVKVDRGAGFASLPQPDRLIIPSGHNLSTNTLEVRHHTSDPADGVTGTLIYGPTAQAAGLRVLTLSSAFSNRYGSITVPASGTAWEFGELWLTVERQTSTSVALEPDYVPDEWEPNLLETKLRGGELYRSELGRALRRMTLRYKALTGADLTLFRDMRTETRDGLFPLYVAPPDDTESPLLMHVVGGFKFEQDHPVPTTGATFTLELRLLEALA